MTVSLSAVPSRSTRAGTRQNIVYLHKPLLLHSSTRECASKQGQRHKEYDLISGSGLGPCDVHEPSRLVPRLLLDPCSKS
jgi:hypothetical protein